MSQYIEYFTNYVYKNYDMNNRLIRLKFYHSLRVAKLMMILAKKLNLSEEETILAFKIGLCHDLGRFYEVVRSGKFDNKAFDHGTYSNKILYNDQFIKYMDVDEHLLFRKSIYNHNKKDITNDLNGKEMIFANMIRDMDKIDIIELRSNKSILDFDSTPTASVIDNYMNRSSIDIGDIKGTTDSTILYLSFIKDLYFDASYDMAIDYGYLDRFLKIVQVSDENKELFDDILNKVTERRGKVYVR